MENGTEVSTNLLSRVKKKSVVGVVLLINIWIRIRHYVERAAIDIKYSSPSLSSPHFM